jgi:hypothetical protein
VERHLASRVPDESLTPKCRGDPPLEDIDLVGGDLVGGPGEVPASPVVVEA